MKGGERVYGNSVLSAQFFYETKTTLIVYSLKKVKIKKTTGLRGARGFEFLGLPHSLMVHVISTAQNTSYAVLYPTTMHPEVDLMHHTSLA